MSSAAVSLTDEALLAAWVELERQRRRLAHAEHVLVAEIETRGLARERGMRSTAVLGTRLLHISPGEARARVQAAQDLGPRRGLTGEALEPIYPLVAAAQAEGAISERHAKLIVDTVERLPDVVRKEHEEQVEADLVGYACQFDPVTLAKTARRITALLDPDGVLEDVAYRHRRRRFEFHRRADGSAYGSFDLDPECAEYAAVVFAALSAPQPAQDGARDARSPEQRCHDAFLELCKLAMRARLLPSSGGVTTTVIITATQEVMQTGTGLATTGTGTLIPATEARRWASSDSRFYAVLIDKAKQSTTYSTGTRLFTENQRLVMIARDRGCSFPGCTAPPALCQAHHIRDFAKHGPTSVDNGALLCGYHHREFAALGWSCAVIDQVPHWTAPAWLDPTRTPQRNRAHFPLAAT